MKLMKTIPLAPNSLRHRDDTGQTVVIVLLALGIFLLGAVGFGVDIANMWFHRQSSQTAADSACMAGATDLLTDAVKGVNNQGGFTAGSDFDCNGKPNASPCQYAALNGYPSRAGSNNIHVSFPDSVPDVETLPTDAVPSQFIRVDVLDHVRTYFSALLTGQPTQNVRATATCALVYGQARIPIVVLNPTLPSTFSMQGTTTVAVIGGPTKSVVVNSDNNNAVSLGGNQALNLECGGDNYAGASIGVVGGPKTGPTVSGTCPGPPVGSGFPPKGGGGFFPGTNGRWISPTLPVSDPLANLPEPDRTQFGPPQVPSDLAGQCASIPCGVCYWNQTLWNKGSANGEPVVCPPGLVSRTHTHGCPDPIGCQLYTPGYYGPEDGFPNGISLTNVTAIFDPGIYYVNGGLGLKSLSMVRPSTGPDVAGSDYGTMFYLTGLPQTCSGQPGLVCAGSNSGKNPHLDPFLTSYVQCPGGAAPDPNISLPSGFNGNVLLAPCTGTYGDPANNQRGVLFFADRAVPEGGGWGGGGSFLIGGTTYFHQCNADGSGQNCPSGAYNSSFQLTGSSGSTSYVVGYFIVDMMHMGGSSAVVIAPNSSAFQRPLVVSLVR